MEARVCQPLLIRSTSIYQCVSFQNIRSNINKLMVIYLSDRYKMNSRYFLFTSLKLLLMNCKQSRGSILQLPIQHVIIILKYRFIQRSNIHIDSHCHVIHNATSVQYSNYECAIQAVLCVCSSLFIQSSRLVACLIYKGLPCDMSQSVD